MTAIAAAAPAVPAKGGFPMTAASFWRLHAGLCAASTFALLLLWRPLKAALAPRHGRVG